MADKDKQMDVQDSRKQALYSGVWILIMLAVLTGGEYIVGIIAPPWGIVLIVVAAFKAYWVLVEYMHIGRLFESEEESHE
jgi:hypothetical protein